jgi:hypothetical protein
VIFSRLFGRVFPRKWEATAKQLMETFGDILCRGLDEIGLRISTKSPLFGEKCVRKSCAKCDFEWRLRRWRAWTSRAQKSPMAPSRFSVPALGKQSLWSRLPQFSRFSHQFRRFRLFAAFGNLEGDYRGW